MPVSNVYCKEWMEDKGIVRKSSRLDGGFLVLFFFWKLEFWLSLKSRKTRCPEFRLGFWLSMAAKFSKLVDCVFERPDLRFSPSFKSCLFLNFSKSLLFEVVS